MLTAAIAANPSYAEAHNNLGVLQRDVGAVQARDPEIQHLPRTCITKFLCKSPNAVSEAQAMMLHPESEGNWIACIAWSWRPGMNHIVG